MIKIESLKESDRGRSVIYLPKSEDGRISSWNEEYIFVVYRGEWQSKATRPDDLKFSQEGE